MIADDWPTRRCCHPRPDPHHAIFQLIGGGRREDGTFHAHVVPTGIGAEMDAQRCRYPGGARSETHATVIKAHPEQLFFQRWHHHASDHPRVRVSIDGLILLGSSAGAIRLTGAAERLLASLAADTAVREDAIFASAVRAVRGSRQLRE
jgi:hypothetical protein